MDALRGLLSPLSSNSNPIQDTLKLVVIGGTVETVRRVSASAWSGFVDSFFLTAHFSQEDYPYDWLMHWLSKQPAWGRSREFDITTRTTSRHGMTQKTTGDLEEEEDGDAEEFSLGGGHRKRKVAIMPSVDTTHTIYYRGHWLRITRTKRMQDYGSCAEIKISVVARNNDILKKLVLEAKKEYEKDAVHRVHIFMADTSYCCWRWNGARQKRPMNSIVLEPGVKDMILVDCKDFLQSEDWYAERGIPFRRGYLLHGVPGSGKTSLIHSLAGELGLDIYVVSLSSKGMSDDTLSKLMGNVPSRCILLLEDLDAAFTRGISRDENSTGAPGKATAATKKEKESTDDDASTLTLSGLLNSLDGVAAAEGRLLFATTNHIERLDPALSRPGRMDVWINFKNATKWQAEGIFKCFFPVKKEVTSETEKSPVTTPLDSQENVLLPPKRKTGALAIPQLSDDELDILAKRFANAIPEEEFSVAALQGYLLKNKTRPRECVAEAPAWVLQERENRAKLKKEKEEREAQAKKEQDEADKKSKEDDKEKEASSSKKEAEECKTNSNTPSNEEATEASSQSSGTDGNNADGPDHLTLSTSGGSVSDKDLSTEPSQPASDDKWISVENNALAPEPSA